MIDYPNKLNKIFDKLNDFNARPIIIGGYVRDKLLQIPLSKDIDIEVYNIASLEKLEEILTPFAKVSSVGKSFGVCKLYLDDLEIDFSLPRTDSKTSAGHTGFHIQCHPNINFKTAASRRDFTINAIGYDVIDKKILDPFHGKDDLKNKLLRAVNLNTFAEDPLRVLRAVQFCARFDLKIDKELFELCRNMIHKGVLKELSKERIFTEIQKLFLQAKQPSKGLQLLKNFGAFDFFTELKSLSDKKWQHTLKAIDIFTQLKTNSSKTDLILMMSLLCKDFKDPNKQTVSFIQKMTNEKALLESVLGYIDALKALKNFAKNLEDVSLYKLAMKVNIEHLLLVYKADMLAANGRCELCETIEKRAKTLGVFNTKAPALIRGRDLIQLGLQPSEKFSKILHDAYEAQIDGAFKCYEDALIWLQKYLEHL